MKIHNLVGLFDEQHVLLKLTALGDPLVLINEHIDFSIFRSDLNNFFKRRDDTAPTKGRPSFDVVMMLKIIFVQRLYNLSDEQIEFQINDRLSFRRFLAIPFSDAVPDCKTVWKFREDLKQDDRIEKVFNTFLVQLLNQGLIAKEGKMLDATLVSVPIQRNSRAENAEIKEGKTPKSFTENKHKNRQKDTDAKWTIKNNVSYYGYKNHVKADTKSKLITQYTITDASVHDSQVCVAMLNESDSNEPFYADSAYQSPEIKTRLEELNMNNKIVEKGARSHPLTEQQKEYNKTKSKTRARVEHIFGYMENSMNNAMFIRTIGKQRAMVILGLNNLVYNICRFVQIKKMKIA